MISKKLSVGKICAWGMLACFFAAGTRCLLAQGSSAANKKQADSYFAYVGAYTRGSSKGIYGYRFDAKTGHFTPMGLAAEVANPSFIATDPSHRFLYAVTEMSKGKANGDINSFAIDAKTGALTFLNKVDAAGGESCHLVVDQTAKTLFVANYGTGSIASFAIRADGSLGERKSFDQLTGVGVNPARQEGPHAHAVVLSPDNRFLFVPDLGTDKIHIYKVDAAKGTFTVNEPAFIRLTPGFGPRHLAFSADAKFAYLLYEMGSSVTVFSYDSAKGALTPVQTISTLPANFKGEDNSAEIEIDRTGRFLYASNRGDDSITVFKIDPHQGTLTKIQTASTKGKDPRNFAIDPTGKYLLAANQTSGQMVVFTIDKKTGLLTPTSQVLDLSLPVCILFVPVPSA
jgi:6-phosphogluconolactonase